MKPLLLSLVVFLPAGEAWAGCANFYEVDPYALPEVDLCILDQCHRTSVLRTCANAHSGFTLFTNGWSQHFSAERDEWIIISADGTSVSEKDFACKPVGEGIEGCY